MIRAVMIEGEANAQKRACFDCHHCQAAISWWCKSEKAKERRGTNIPDATDCEDWKPVEHIKNMTRWQRFMLNFDINVLKIRGK